MFFNEVSSQQSNRVKHKPCTASTAAYYCISGLSLTHHTHSVHAELQLMWNLMTNNGSSAVLKCRMCSDCTCWGSMRDFKLTDSSCLNFRQWNNIVCKLLLLFSQNH